MELVCFLLPHWLDVSSLHFLLDPAPGGAVARAERHAHRQEYWREPGDVLSNFLSTEELDHLQEPNS